MIQKLTQMNLKVQIHFPEIKIANDFSLKVRQNKMVIKTKEKFKVVAPRCQNDVSKLSIERRV